MIRVEPEKNNHSPSCAVVNQLGEHERNTSSGSKNQNGNHFEWSLIPFAHSFSKTGVFRCGNEPPAAIVISGKGGRWLWSPSSRHSRGSSRSFQRCEGNDTFTRVGRTVFLVQPPSSSAFFGSSISAKRKWFAPPPEGYFKVVPGRRRRRCATLFATLFCTPKWRSTKYQSSLAEGKFLGTVLNTAVANPTNEGDNILSQTAPALHHSTYSRAKRAANWIGRSIPHPSLPPYQPDWPIRKNTALLNTLKTLTFAPFALCDTL